MIHLAAALDGTGRHPASWRQPGARPADLFTLRYWADLVGEAEWGLLDFVTFEDELGLQSASPVHPDARTDQVRGRLDAVLTAAAIAPLTSRIGLVPATDVRHTEPFHVSIGVASLDHASRGRAGWHPRVATRAADAAHFGRRAFPDTAAALFDEAAEVIEAVRRLWDSWEDDAEIRDVASGRFIDRDKLHYVDFEGAHFSVRGPSITPRPPQGQPLVTVSAHATRSYELAATGADVVYVTPHSRAEAETIVGRVRAAEATAGRSTDPLKIFADLLVFLDPEPGAAAARRARLDDLDPLTADIEIFTGTPDELADLLLAWAAAGLDGFRLHPGVLPQDLTAVTTALVPELQRRGAFRTAYEVGTLRGLLGLPRPANRFASGAPR